MEAKWIVFVFLASLVIYAGFLLASVYCLVRSYFRFEYQLLPDPNQIETNAAALEAHYEAEFDDAKRVDEHVKTDIQANIIILYRDSGTFNRHSNVTRIAWLHRTTQWIICSLITLVISRGIFYFGLAESKPQEIRVSNFPNGTLPVQIQNPAPKAVIVEPQKEK